MSSRRLRLHKAFLVTFLALALAFLFHIAIWPEALSPSALTLLVRLMCCLQSLMAASITHVFIELEKLRRGR